MTYLLDIGEIEGRAAFVRKKCGLDQLEPPYPTNLITSTSFTKVHITGDKTMPNGITEMVVRDRGRFALFYSRKVGAPSQRLGILHGCYHTISDLAVVDGQRECNLGDRKFRRFNPDLDVPEERACDLFAGALLVPFHVLDRMAPETLFPGKQGSPERHAFDDQVDRLASKFAVPAGFMNWRLYDLAQLRRTHFYR
jgi:hypothetical protein